MFECELSEVGLPVDWMKGDRVLRRGDKYTMTSVGNIHTLTINDADGNDAGEYTAICKSKTTSATLTVEGLEYYYAPKNLNSVFLHYVYNLFLLFKYEF